MSERDSLGNLPGGKAGGVANPSGDKGDMEVDADESAPTPPPQHKDKVAGNRGSEKMRKVRREKKRNKPKQVAPWTPDVGIGSESDRTLTSTMKKPYRPRRKAFVISRYKNGFSKPQHSDWANAMGLRLAGAVPDNPINRNLRQR